MEPHEPTDGGVSVGMRMAAEQHDENDYQVRGRLQVYLNGELVNDQENLIVTAGHNMLAHRFWGQSSPPGPISHVAIGTGTATPDAGDTALGTEVHRNATGTFTRASNVLTITASFGNGEGNGTISEAGCFNAASGGDMYARSLLNPPRVKQSADTLDITWTLTF